MTIDFPEDPIGRELILMIERAKYERWLSGEIADILSAAFNDVVSTILSPSFRSLSQFEQARKLALFRELDRQIKAGYITVRQATLKQMSDYAQLEAQIALKQISTVAEGDVLTGVLGPLLSTQTVQAIAALPIQGLSLGDWFSAQAENMSRETRRVIQNGLLTGRTLPDMVRQIIPPRGSVAPAVLRRARNDAMAVTRTTVNAVQNFAALESYIAAGEDVSDSFRLIAVRDSRTTAICRALDGLVQRNDDPAAKRPPFHIGCRTSVSPIVTDAFQSKRDQKTQPLTFGSYGSWLREQTSSEQDSILGATRADLWRNGRMTLADAVDSDNRVLTLEQLRQRLGISAARVPAHAGAF